MLQQGRFVADLVYFNGEGAPNAVPYWKPLDPAPPAGFDYDWVSAELLLNRMTVEAGRIVLPSGMRYRALVLPADVDQLTLPMAKKLRDARRGGSDPHRAAAGGLRRACATAPRATTACARSRRACGATSTARP